MIVFSCAVTQQASTSPADLHGNVFVSNNLEVFLDIFQSMKGAADKLLSP
jgi:hypothetical protein